MISVEGNTQTQAAIAWKWRLGNEELLQLRMGPVFIFLQVIIFFLPYFSQYFFFHRVNFQTISIIPTQYFIDFVELEKSIQQDISPSNIVLHLLNLLNFRIKFNKLKVVPKFLELYDALLNDIGKDDSKILSLISIFEHEECNNTHLIQSDVRIMHMVNYPVQNFQVNLFVRLLLDKGNNPSLKALTIQFFYQFKQLVNKLGIYSRHLLIDFTDDLHSFFFVVFFFQSREMLFCQLLCLFNDQFVIIDAWQIVIEIQFFCYAIELCVKIEVALVSARVFQTPYFLEVLHRTELRFNFSSIIYLLKSNLSH